MEAEDEFVKFGDLFEDYLGDDDDVDNIVEEDEGYEGGAEEGNNNEKTKEEEEEANKVRNEKGKGVQPDLEVDEGVTEPTREPVVDEVDA